MAERQREFVGLGAEESGGRGAAERRSEGVSLVAVCGLPGVGKSTVARRVADRLEAEALRTDVVRKERFDDPEYTDAETAAVYDELLARAADRLAAGDRVVLDATFKSRERRLEARDLAEDLDCGFRLVHVDCEASVVERRIAARDGVSDADFEVHLALRERFEPVEMDHLAVDNSGSEAETRRQVDAAFRLNPSSP
jgi:predicted kinase